MNESELEGAFDFALMKQGVRQHAFQTIVAGGARATTLHYSENNQIVEDGELVLIDLGSAEKHYAADISRTFPVNGRFTERQKEIYNTVLEAQRIVIAAAKPGLTTRDLNQLVIDYYESRLDELGLRKDGKGVRDYYYHGVSHGLGLDTHDISTERERTLKPGMVITVEPGMYIEDEGIGVRIENDVLITEDGCIDLSIAIPRTVEEIEAIMAK
jgi:Xaa-Pro aminopeptidase